MITKQELEEIIAKYNRGEDTGYTDEEYDKILEEYLQATGEERPYTRQKQTGDVNEIVGTLPKAYGVDVAFRENQSTYMDTIRRVGLPESTTIILQPKFDGCSIALDVNTMQFFTRGDYVDGESMDVTDVFKDHIKFIDIENNITAIKFEAIMSSECFDQLGLNKEYKRARDAVNAIIRKNNEYVKYITLIPLRQYNGVVESIPKRLLELCSKTTAGNYQHIKSFIADKLSDGATQMYNNMTFAIDGVVASEIKEDNTTGYEVAIKILNDVKETKLINVINSFGKTGKCTPVATFEPIKFGNVEVTNATLSTWDRIASMGLKMGDTVRVTLNIVPYLLTSYHDGTIPVPIPKVCPICGAPLSLKTLATVRCTNPNCSGLKIGMIYRYCENMNMKGIAKATLTSLFDAGLLTDIDSLYKLDKLAIMELPGFGETSASAILDIIHEASINVDICKWLGSLPIKDISDKTWKAIIGANFNNDMMTATNVIHDIIENGTPDMMIDKLFGINIKGVSFNTIQNINEGLMNYWEVIQRTLPFITFNVLSSVQSIGLVTLTGTRDKELTDYLIKKGYEVNNFKSDTIAVVVPNKEFTSATTTKALQKGIPIYTIEEAYEKL